MSLQASSFSGSVMGGFLAALDFVPFPVLDLGEAGEVGGAVGASMGGTADSGGAPSNWDAV